MTAASTLARQALRGALITFLAGFAIFASPDPFSFFARKAILDVGGRRGNSQLGFSHPAVEIGNRSADAEVGFSFDPPGNYAELVASQYFKQWIGHVIGYLNRRRT